MTAADALELVLPLFQVYYDITRENVTEPFQVEAAFHSHEEQYFLLKSAKYTECDAHEYVFFATPERLDLDTAKQLDETAWETGMSRVEPHRDHRNTDVSLLILADVIEPTARSYLRRLHRSKSYGHMLQGWSNYRVVAIELSSGRLTSNRLGRDLKKLFRNIQKSNS